MNFFKKYKDTFILYGGLLLAFIVLVLLAILPQKQVPYSSTAIDLGFFEIQWYAIFILSGITFAGIMAYFEMKRKNMDTDILWDGLLYGVPLAIVGARIWYILFNLDQVKTFIDLFAIWEGGLAIHGGVIVTFLFLIWFTRFKKISYWAFLDIVAPGFLIGQTLGRWGNFMNQELYGAPVNHLNFLPKFISEQMYINGQFRQPTFLYESLWNFVGLVFILIIRRFKVFKIGDALAFYLTWYGVGRIITESMRLESGVSEPLMAFGIPVSILVSVLFILSGIALFVLKRIYAKDLPYYVDYKVESVAEKNV